MCCRASLHTLLEQAGPGAQASTQFNAGSTLGAQARTLHRPAPAQPSYSKQTLAHRPTPSAMQVALWVQGLVQVPVATPSNTRILRAYTQEHIAHID